jgi:hypothetical protein
MTWPYKKLGELANAVANTIEEELGTRFTVEGLEDDFEDGLVFIITEPGVPKAFAAVIELRIRDKTISSRFYAGRKK